MSLLVVGTVAFDTVVTSSDKRRDVLGGSATYFSYAASFYSPVRLVAVVGGDFPAEYRQLLAARPIDLSGLEVRQDAETFRWTGKYSSDMNERKTLEVHLNVIAQAKPCLPQPFRKSPFVFLANDSPETQRNVLHQVESPRLAVADTMDLWIQTKHDQLLELLREVDGLVVNDQEVKMLAGMDNVIRAGRETLKMGPKFVIVKKGEHGAIFLGKEDTFVLPAFPTHDVVDPTGAGDSFAGGIMGYIASQGEVNRKTLLHGMACGIVIASFVVEGFSLDRLKELGRPDIDGRVEQYRTMISF